MLGVKNPDLLQQIGKKYGFKKPVISSIPVLRPKAAITAIML
jgi:hypothetical protein